MSVQITVSEFRELKNRFIFQGGSEFGNSIADTIDNLKAEVEQLKKVALFKEECRVISESERDALALQNKQLREALEVVHAQLIDGKIFTQQMHQRPYWRYSVSDCLALPDLSTEIIKRHDAEQIRLCIQMIQSGNFLHDQAPAKLFSNEVCARLEREALKLEQTK